MNKILEISFVWFRIYRELKVVVVYIWGREFMELNYFLYC